MRSALKTLAAVAGLAPAVAAAQPYADGRYGPRAQHGDDCEAYACTGWQPRPPPPPCGQACGRPPYRAMYPQQAWTDPRGYAQGYYRDYYRAPQYGYTYGSARGRGYGYSYGDYAGPPPFESEW